MKLTTEQAAGGITIVRVAEARVMYPMLGDFMAAVAPFLAPGKANLVIDLSPVTYIDSSTIGCLMDLYRQVSSASGHLRLAGVQKRVQTLLKMTGAQNFIQIHDDTDSALKSFGG